MPEAMKAAFVREFGAPLTIEETPLPTPGPGQVLVKIAACGVCHTEEAAFTYRQEAGQTAHTIVRIVKEEQIDLIVLGSRSLGGLQAFLLGSVSERVAHLAHCSVLIDRQH